MKIIHNDNDNNITIAKHATQKSVVILILIDDVFLNSPDLWQMNSQNSFWVLPVSLNDFYEGIFGIYPGWGFLFQGHIAPCKDKLRIEKFLIIL